MPKYEAFASKEISKRMKAVSLSRNYDGIVGCSIVLNVQEAGTEYRGIQIWNDPKGMKM